MLLKWNETRHRYDLESRFEDRDKIKQIGGLRWDPPAKRWWTVVPEIAARYIAVADEEVKKRLNRTAEIQKESFEASRAVSADIEVPAPEGYKYMPFQLAGVKFSLDHPNSINCDEMGLGKSVEACGVINALPDIKSVLILCPANAKNVWLDHCQRWLVRPFEVGVAYGDRLPINADVVIVNYDIAHRHEEALRSIPWDIMILDEVHVLRSVSALRSKMVFGYRPKRKEIRKAENAGLEPPREIPPIPARRKLYLSGTPLVNRPKELWPILHSLDPDRWRDEWGFYRKFCDAQLEYIRVKGGHGEQKAVWKLDGSSNETELQRVLRETLMIRREFSEVLPEIPPMVVQTISLDPTAQQTKAIQEEMVAAKSWVKSLDELKNGINNSNASGNPDLQRRASVKLMVALKVGFQEMSRVRHQTALAKVSTIIEYAKDLLDNQEIPKLGIWLHHRDVVAAVKDAMKPYGCVSIVGGDSDTHRKQAEVAFQNDPKIKVFIGSITAAGVAITLTAARMAIAGELSYVPGDMAQAYARHHRKGTTGSVLIHQLVLKGSLDERVLEISEGKQEVIDAILDDDPQLSVSEAS